MRVFTSLSTIILFAGTAIAQNDVYQATKQDAIGTVDQSSASGSGGIMPLFQMTLALAIVIFLLKALLPKLASRMNRSLNTKLGSAIKIEETASFAGGNLYLVKVRDRELLLSSHTSGINCLADLTKSAKTPEEPAFFEILEEKTKTTEITEQRESTSDLYPNTLPNAVPENLEVALSRLNRIAQ